MRVYFSHGEGGAAQRGVEQLSQSVQKAGFEALVGQRAGSDWQKTLEQQLSCSDAMVFVVDPESGRNQWLQREWSAAVEQLWSHPETPVVPILVGDAEAPPFLRDRQAIRVSPEGNWEEAAKTVLSALEGGPAAKVVPQTAPEVVHAEKQQRLSRIAEEAARLTPTEADSRAKIDELIARLAEARQRNSEAAEVADLEIKLADALKLAGQKEEAVAHLQAALPLLDELSGRPEAKRQLARAHLNLGRSLGSLGRATEALSHWTTALARYEELDGRNSLMVASINASLATLYTKLGDTKAADEHRKAFRAGFVNMVTSVPIVGRFLGGLFAPKQQGAKNAEGGAAKASETDKGEQSGSGGGT